MLPPAGALLTLNSGPGVPKGLLLEFPVASEDKAGMLTLTLLKVLGK